MWNVVKPGGELDGGLWAEIGVRRPADKKGVPIGAKRPNVQKPSRTEPLAIIFLLDSRLQKINIAGHFMQKCGRVSRHYLQLQFDNR